MIELIQRLEHNGYIYRIDDGIYFDTSKLTDYGKLAKLDIKGLKAGARIDIVSGKKHPTDFALWKFSPKDHKRQMEWNSPWGVGFPGWHIECSAMSLKYLGNAFENDSFHGERSRTIDIHSGGVDHISIHHTNEIAQSETATKKPFVKYWVHFAHLLVDNTKMSKSKNNFYTKDDIKSRGFDLLDLRYLYLNTHYRTTMNFTWESITSAHQALKRLREMIMNLKNKSNKTTKSNKTNLTNETINDYKQSFSEAVNNDLNIPQALSMLWRLIEDTKIDDKEKLDLIYEFDKIFGLNLNQEYKEEKVPQEILDLVGKREGYRRNKEWVKSDEIRKEIESKDYLVEDTKEGSKVSRIKDLKI